VKAGGPAPMSRLGNAGKGSAAGRSTHDSGTGNLRARSLPCCLPSSALAASYVRNMHGPDA